jgi:hypothetical protein
VIVVAAYKRFMLISLHGFSMSTLTPTQTKAVAKKEL